MPRHFNQRLASGERLHGTIITLACAEIMEIFCRAGFDWLFIDLEHSALGIREAQHLLQVAGAEMPCLLRVPANEAVWLKKALDCGASGIIVPQVNTAQDALRAVQFSKYPPQGSRSVGIARAHAYGTDFTQYVAKANDETSLIVQIEHIEAVQNIDSILQVAGIDGLFVGPYDLSASMGKTGLVSDPEVQAAIATVTRAAKRAKLPLGIFGANAEAVAPHIEKGYTLIATGIDTLMIAEAARALTGPKPAGR